MSRNASGTYSLPAGNPVVAGTTIEASWANTTLSDIRTELTDSLSRSGKGGMLAALHIVDGSVSAPGLGFEDEAALGFYRSASNTLDFVQGAARKMRINGTQVLVNPTSGVADFEVVSADGEAKVTISSGGSTADEGRVELSMTADVLTLRAIDDDDSHGQTIFTVDLADNQPVQFTRPVDGSSDSVRKTIQDNLLISPRYEGISVNTTVDTSDLGRLFIADTNLTLNLPAISGITNGFYFHVRCTSGVSVTVDPNSSETIDGVSTYSVGSNSAVTVVATPSSGITDWIVLSGLVNPMTNAEDIIIGGSSGAPTRLAKGSNGTVLKVDSSGEVNYGSSLNLGSEQATTSGTTITFSSIPSWVRRITVNIEGLSTNGTSAPIIQLGDSGGLETTGYLGACGTTVNSGNGQATNFTTGIGLSAQWTAASTLHGTLTLTLKDGTNDTWIASWSGSTSNAAFAMTGSSSKSLSDTLTQLALTTVGGSDTFDAGSINITWE